MKLQDPKKLKRLMIVQEVTTRQLGEASGYSHVYISNLCTGKATTATPEAAARIANFLKVGIEDLFLTKVSHQVVVNSPSVKTARRAA